MQATNIVTDSSCSKIMDWTHTWKQHGAWTSTWPWVVILDTLTAAWSWAATRLKGINMAFGGITSLIKSTDPHMALSDCTDQRHQHGPWPAAWLLAMALISEI